MQNCHEENIQTDDLSCLITVLNTCSQFIKWVSTNLLALNVQNYRLLWKVLGKYIYTANVNLFIKEKKTKQKKQTNKQPKKTKNNQPNLVCFFRLSWFSFFFFETACLWLLKYKVISVNNIASVRFVIGWDIDTLYVTLYLTKDHSNHVIYLEIINIHIFCFIGRHSDGWWQTHFTGRHSSLF